MVTEVDFLFLVEHEDREAATVKRIASHLLAQGKTVKVLSVEFHAHRFRAVRPRCVIFPYAIDSDRWPVSYFKSEFGASIHYVSLNWEQLLSEANKDFKRPKDSLVKRGFHHLAWSDDYKGFLVDSGVAPDNIEVLGNPSHELLLEACRRRDELRPVLCKRFRLDTNKEILFLPMNYGWAFASDNLIKAKIGMGYDEAVAWEYRKYSRACLNQFALFARDLINETNLQLVIRPHPSISVQQYLEVFGEIAPQAIDKILFSKDLTIREWVAISDIVGSSWSTTVWDSANVGKKVFLFTPLPRPDWLETWWNPLVPNVSSAKDLNLDELEPLGSSIDPAKISETIAHWLCNLRPVNSPLAPTGSSMAVRMYCLRAYLRDFSMRRLRGAFVTPGLRRDYFDPSTFLSGRDDGNQFS